MYKKKFDSLAPQTLYSTLTSEEQKFIFKLAQKFLFTFQELKKISLIAKDFWMWQERPLYQLMPTDKDIPSNKKALFELLRQTWEQLKENPHYNRDNRADPLPAKELKQELIFEKKDADAKILGACPVASPKTLCCQLQTLDVITNCAFFCSYCSIQSFFSPGTISVENSLKSKLDKLNLNPQKIYHWGTGQSSDSLHWGNRAQTQATLIQFADDNPNVILELKSKSDNISYLEEQVIPRNLIVTWSLNTPTIIQNEEHLTASLSKRLDAARALADKGVLVGFHFHPMIFYQGWEQEYKNIFNEIMQRFSPSEVLLISFGTVTYTKKVIRALRKRKIRSKILQMPIKDASGKLSYDKSIKIKLFTFAYKSFTPWHNQVFFYLCMEERDIWQEVFNFTYKDNEHFATEMKSKYIKKINKKLIG